jgi:hypothetical protein
MPRDMFGVAACTALALKATSFGIIDTMTVKRRCIRNVNRSLTWAMHGSMRSCWDESLSAAAALAASQQHSFAGGVCRGCVRNADALPAARRVSR